MPVAVIFIATGIRLDLALWSKRLGRTGPPVPGAAPATFAGMSPSGNGHRRFARPDEELRRLTALVELGRTNGNTGGEDGLLASTLTTVAGILPGHAIAIAMDDEGEVRIPDRRVRGRLPVEAAVLVAAVSIDRAEAVERKDGDRTILALPLGTTSSPFGALVVHGPHSGVSETDRTMLEALAQQLSLALENLRLREQVDRLMFRNARN